MKQPQTRGDVIAGPPVNLPPPATWPESDVLPANGPVSETCPHGHPRSAENTYTDPNGYRRCRICQREQRTAHRADPNYLTRPYRKRAGADGRGAPRYWVGGVCRQGHVLDEANAYVSKTGVRCKTCRSRWGRTYNQKQAQTVEELRAQAGHTDHYSLLPKIDLFYSEQDKVWIARFRNTATLDGLSGLGSGAADALIELSHAYSLAHGKPHMGGNLLVFNDNFWEVPDANTP